MDDERSPWWVFVLVTLIHAAVWAAAAAEWCFALYVVPRRVWLFGELGVSPPASTERYASLFDVYERTPVLFWVLPLLDLAVLFILHRVLHSRVLRCLWSLFVIIGLLLLLLWGAAAASLALWKLQEALSR